LGGIADKFAEAGQFDQALQIARTIEAPEGKAYELSQIADKYVKATRFEEAGRILDEAKQIAETIKDPTSKYSTLESLSASYAQAGQFDQATQVGATIENPYFKTSALQAIAEIYEKAGQIDKAVELLSQAVQVIKTVKQGKDYSAPRNSAENTLMEMAGSYYATKGQFTLALYVVKSLDDVSDQAYTLARIGGKYARCQTLDGHARHILHDIIAANE